MRQTENSSPNHSQGYLGARLRGNVDLLVDKSKRSLARLARRCFVVAFPLVRRLFYDLVNQSVFTDSYTQETLLADRVRVDAYRAAIERYVHEASRVLDLGTGTGILAFLAAGRQPAKVWAIDHSAVIDVARKVRDANGLSCVELVRVNSRKLELSEKVDVIIHEQMGHALFDEQMVLNVTDLRDRFLKPGGRILPARFDFYLDPVQLKEEFTVPFVWEQTIHGVDFSVLEETRSITAHDYNYKLLAQHEYDHFLCGSEPALQVDLDVMHEGDLPGRFRFRRIVISPGRLDGICVHFVARFDDEVSISTSPFAARTSWKVPLLRVQAHRYKLGDAVEVALDATDLTNPRTWRWSVTPAAASAL